MTERDWADIEAEKIAFETLGFSKRELFDGLTRDVATALREAEQRGAAREQDACALVADNERDIQRARIDDVGPKHWRLRELYASYAAVANDIAVKIRARGTHE